ncbi:putative bifunctional diguanylate cyclase/phosphodiesterase [Silvibacterium acidisoli]|uniref:putative bifunctional diguanylate cyclase/phosphodiesterase n=1 Tax=Acidobacteriaceae bacterium ZG23-2 TaxID=2883246 RepID=UPI00406CC6B7
MRDGTAIEVVEDSFDTATVESVQKEADKQYRSLCARTDRYFGWLMPFQWISAIILSIWVSPISWAGDTSYLHPHVSMALLYGGLITLTPLVLIRLMPGEKITRLTVAANQMLMSSLLIHLTGGRIETHFHIFGSLALLACYLDWQVLLVASVVIAADHILRGIFLPFSIFGSYAVQPWRWLEHIGWVIFCDFFLIFTCFDRLRSLRMLAVRHIERGELLHRAYHDALTGLPNRIYLSHKIERSIDECRRNGNSFSCLYVDLDRFKEVNDKMGHTCGDILLRSVASRMRERLGEDALLARIGGDEFVAVLPHRDNVLESAEETARSLLRVLLQPFDLDDTRVAIGASIGISKYPRDGEDEVELLHNSDKAMYRVKRSGRNGYLAYSAEIFRDARKLTQAEERLRAALLQNEFDVHYQPLYYSNGKMSGLEALLRWTDPQRGNVPPSEFIPLAEETGLIIQLGEYVLDRVCRQASAWHSAGLLVGPVAVNISSLQLGREDFARNVLATLERHNTSPAWIELEVTESAVMGNFALAERQLRDLRTHGVLISIDDFGTGHSTLSRLRQLTFDTLKIDRLFVESTANSHTDRLMVEHIIHMAHSLGMKVVAEGVETEEQLAALRSLECDQVQGYLFSRPLNAASVEDLLVQQNQPALLTEGSASSAERSTDWSILDSAALGLV